MSESAPAETPTLPMELPPPDAVPPTAWTGGVPSGVRLTGEERRVIRELFVAGCSYSKIAELTKHGRKTIAAVIGGDAELVKQLQATRAARMLVEEDMLMEERSEALEKKRDAGKLSVADLNSAIMINGMLVKDAGGSAPQRVRLEADPSLVLAAQLFAGVGKVPGAGTIITVPAEAPAALPEDTGLTPLPVVPDPAMSEPVPRRELVTLQDEIEKRATPGTQEGDEESA